MLRTNTSPGPGDGSSTSAKAKVSSVGQPLRAGRESDFLGGNGHHATFSSTSMLPRVALEYGHIWCAPADQLLARPHARGPAARCPASTARPKPSPCLPMPTSAVTDESVELDLLLTCHRLQRAVETGRVARGEQLLRVGARAAGAAQLLRDGQVQLQHAVGRRDMAVSGSAGGLGFRGVERVHVRSPSSGVSLCALTAAVSDTRFCRNASSSTSSMPVAPAILRGTLLARVRSAAPCLGQVDPHRPLVVHAPLAPHVTAALRGV